MGNICQISCDGAMFNRCLDCFLEKAAYIRNLQENVVTLETELEKLIAAKDDVMNRVVTAERQQMRRLNKVQFWLSRVEDVKTEADELTRDGAQEIMKLCLGGYCSKNCKSSYKLGKRVARKLQLVKELMNDGFFEMVAERAPESVADERPTELTVVGLQSMLEQVWRCLVAEPVGIVGLYGMGGVGKTTLLTHINNKFVNRQTDFDYVIWVVVSKDHRLENIQQTIGKKIGLFDNNWKDRSVDEKALDIFKVLREKKFVLLLDDIWERVDLIKVGVPLPSPQSTASKVVFTTRFIDVCGSMEAHKKFKVECLSDEEAWELFQKKVGEETLHSHSDILHLAQSVAKECDGLPLALITVGRAMASKKTPEEWRHAVEVLRRSASKFAGLGKEVYPLLKFSYDSLPNDAIKSCLLYCCLYPEDYTIDKSELIDCWLCEGFLDESHGFGARNQGYSIVGTLIQACLLEEADDDFVKMHDVIRDMVLWITCEIEKEKENFLVYAGVGLTEAPDVKSWEHVKRLSLMQNEIESLPNVPTCIHLLTLFLGNNTNIKMITGGFFKFMHSLRVLNMSWLGLKRLPLEVSKLVSLQFLDISWSYIKELPEELKALVNLTCFNLNGLRNFNKIPHQLISSFSKLLVLRMYRINFEDFDDGGKCFIKELLGLKYLEVLDLSLGTSQSFQYFLSSPKFRSCTQSLFLEHLKDRKSVHAPSLAELKHLNKLCIWRCAGLEELKIDYTGKLQKTCRPSVFHSLQSVSVFICNMLKDLTFLVFAPNLRSLYVNSCNAMEEIISVGKFAEIPEMIGNSNPFDKLQRLDLYQLSKLKSIYWKPLPFTQLKEMFVWECDELKKLPLDSKSTKEPKFAIHGTENWWKELQWEDEATQNVFRPCLKTRGLW